MKKEVEIDLIEQGKMMVVEYYNRYSRQIMNRYPKIFKKRITVDDVKILNHAFADNIEEIEMCTKDDEELIYRVVKDMDTNTISSYQIKRTKKED